jgi:hypothetical protein
VSEQQEALRRARQRVSSPPAWSFTDVQGQLTSPVQWNPSQSRGPASNLQTFDPEELYSKYVPSGDSQVRGVPFGREFDFTETAQPPSGFLSNQTGTIAERSRRFIDQYFGGQDSVVANPATGSPYGNELKIHDALHEYTNTGNTLRAEELITAGESAATRPLAGAGLLGLTQQDFDLGAVIDPDRSARRGEGGAIDQARAKQTLIQQRGSARGSSLFRDRNSVSSFLSPPLSFAETGEIIRRSREFYDQVHSGWGEYLNSQGKTTKQASEDSTVLRRGAGTAASDPFVQGVAPNLEIRGGYRDPGGMPFGPKEQLMNPPMVPVVGYEDWNRSLGRQIAGEAKGIERRAQAERAAYRSEENQKLRMAREVWHEKSSGFRSAVVNGDFLGFGVPENVQTQYEIFKNALELSGNRAYDFQDKRIYMPEELGHALNVAIGPRPVPRELGDNAKRLDNVRETYGSESLGNIERSVRDHIDFEVRRENSGGVKAGLPGYKGQMFLNPPNLGAPASGSVLPDSMKAVSNSRATDILLNAAADAKDLPRVRNAIRSTTAGAAALGGALPLVSEEIWRSVGRDDYGQAARQTAVETGIGAGVGVALGPVGGAFQRIAPAAAPVVGRALGAAGLATLPTEAVKAYSGFLEERTGRGLPQRTRETQDTMAGMTPSMRAASPRRTYTEGWITVPGKGRRWRDAQGNFYMQQPGTIRTAPAQTARQAVPQLFPTPRAVPANTPSGVAQVTRTQQQNPVIREARNRAALFRQRFNPAQGEFGLTELLMGR